MTKQCLEFWDAQTEVTRPRELSHRPVREEKRVYTFLIKKINHFDFYILFTFILLYDSRESLKKRENVFSSF